MSEHRASLPHDAHRTVSTAAGVVNLDRGSEAGGLNLATRGRRLNDAFYAYCDRISPLLRLATTMHD
jgi:hypothetical protein